MGLCWQSLYIYLSTKMKSRTWKLLSILSGAKWGLELERQHSNSFEKLHQKEVGRRSVLCMILVDGGTCCQTFILAEACFSSGGADVSVNDFCAVLWRNARPGLVKSPESTWLSADSFARFPQSTECPIPDLHSEPLSGCFWRSVAAVASDLIFAEADSKRHFLVGVSQGSYIDTEILYFLILCVSLGQFSQKNLGEFYWTNHWKFDLAKHLFI